MPGMDDAEMLRSPVPPPAPSPVADTMVRVQAMLARGSAPTFESLLAFGEPGQR